MFNNHALLSAECPFVVFHKWKDKGINTVADLCLDHSPRSFTELSLTYDLPRNSFFFHLQIQSALKAFGVPWGEVLEPHPLVKLCSSGSSKGLVSKFYLFCIKAAEKPLLLASRWEHDLSISPADINWSSVWANISLSSRNPNHQMIHFNFVHRTYCTPKKRFLMELAPSPNCDLCQLGVSGSFLHMVWECQAVKIFWGRVANKLSAVLGRHIPISPNILLLNDLSELELSVPRRRWFLAGLTAAKKMVAQRWKAPFLLPFSQWLSATVNIAKFEMSIARMHGAREVNVKSWLSFIAALQT